MHLYYDDWLTPKKGNYPLPCQSIESLTYDYSETKGVDKSQEPRFMVIVHFPNLKYRQIEHVQEYDFESLVGNIGGQSCRRTKEKKELRKDLKALLNLHV